MNVRLKNFIGLMLGLSVGIVIVLGLVIVAPGNFPLLLVIHCMATFAGALTTFVVAETFKLRLSIAVGVVFLCAGIVSLFIVPAPAWFFLLDLVCAYLPMAWLAVRLGERLQNHEAGLESFQ